MSILVGTARKTDEFPQDWPEPRRLEGQYDLAWGKGYDAAYKEGIENPHDAAVEPLSHAEWAAGFNDAQNGGFSAKPIEQRRLDKWFQDEGVED